MIGYKAFDKNLQCRGYQFEVGKTYETGAPNNELKLCTDTVFHFCRELHRIEVVSSYKLKESRVCEVIAEGAIVTDEACDKYGTNALFILREIPLEELQSYSRRNSGNCNSGNCNSGDVNSGDYNSGDYNSGDSNAGNWNSGDRNAGNWNSGYFNSGDFNSGHRNSGDLNSGDFNSGNRNSGYCNSGDWNSGYFNSGDWNSGFFNSDEPHVRMFNKDTQLKRDSIRIPRWCYFNLTEWVKWDKATPEEQIKHELEFKTSDGFLKTLDYKKAWKKAWDKASKDEHRQLLDLPNWDNAIFRQITGIDAELEIAQEE